MSTIGQIERATQNRVVKLFREKLGYAYLGNWEEREYNRNIEPDYLRAWLKRQGHADALINKVLYELEKAVGDTSKSLYDRNRAGYELLRYGTIQTPEKHYLTWKEESPNWKPGGNTDTKYLTEVDYPGVSSPMDVALIQMCGKARFLNLLHNFIVFDAGTKKLCRHNQFFGVCAAQPFIQRREGGIIWNTQGSGKSLMMVWLAKWIRENITDPRALIVTDRTELDEQIEKVFKGVNEDIYRTDSGADMIARINSTKPWLLCSLVHKFGTKKSGEGEADTDKYIEELKQALPPGFKPKGNLFVFVDEYPGRGKRNGVSL